MTRTAVRRRSGATLLLATMMLAASACSITADEPRSRGSAQPSTPVIEPSGPNDVDEDLPPAPVSPTWDAASRASATAAATSAMDTFTSHLSDEAAWWRALAPQLSGQAAADYAGTSPAEVPARAVTGKATLVDDASAYLAVVKVPTDAGAYQVMLSRAGAGEPWLVERLTPPQGRG